VNASLPQQARPDLPRAPSFRLDGRRALITGAGRGIGLACAAALADAGAEVWLAARTADEVESAAHALRERSQKARAVVLDVTRRSEVAEVVSRHGPFQVLVNNAGTNRPKLAEYVTEDDVDTLLALNVKAAFFVAREVARGLRAAGLPGSIVQMSSQMGHVGAPRRSIYCATKHALEGMTKALALEWGPSGIRVNTVCPTFVETPMTRDWLAQPEFAASVSSQIALGRVGQVEDITGAVLYLASDASSLVTGSSLKVDGGWTAS
jgi:NAD(P)-dependent dehydrogenase (short-subunit alcohol dehydrogenase family)